MNLLGAFASGLLAAAVWGQAEVPVQAPPSVVDCRLCHTSDAPTKEKPSLVKCPRAKTKGVHSTAEAPRTIKLGEPGAAYPPVSFSHKAHAEMSEMGGGCYRCHHYDQGGRIQRCEACHSKVRLREDLGKPDWRGAIHRLCIECHRNWDRTTECASCHGNRAMPKIALPKNVVYRTDFKLGKVVTFPHDEHSQSFGLKCADCHRRHDCSDCHARARVPRIPRVNDGSLETAHKSCSACHAKTGCAACHKGEGKKGD